MKIRFITINIIIIIIALLIGVVFMNILLRDDIYIYIFIYLFTPCSTVLIEKLTGPQPVKKFPTFCGTKRFITTFTSAQHLSRSWASSIQPITPTFQFLKIQLDTILPSTPGSPKKPLSLRSPRQNPGYTSPLPHTRYMPHPFHSSRFYQPKNNGWAVQIIKLLIT